MSTAITFYFKDIFPTYDEFDDFLNDFNIVSTVGAGNAANLNFAQYLYKILFRRYHNSNVQYDTIEDFKLDFANVLEDCFAKYKQQMDILTKIHALTEKELITLNTALANNSLNPNTVVDDPTEPLEYISAQAYSYTQDNKLNAFLRAMENIPGKLIDTMLRRCVNLFKTVLTNQIFIYEGEE